MLGCCPFVTSWSPILSSISAATPHLKKQVAPASARARSAWSRKSCAADKLGDCGAGEFGPRPPFPIGPDALRRLSMQSPNLAASAPWVGRCRPIFSTYSLSSAIARTGCVARGMAGLVGALTYFGLDTIGAQEKDRCACSSLRGGPWSESERKEFLNYCATDTVALEQLLPAMLPWYRSPARPAPRSLHDGRGRHGMERRHRSTHRSSALAEPLDGYPG